MAHGVGETDRLAGPEKLKLPGGGPDDRFARIMRVTARAFAMPIAFVEFAGHGDPVLVASLGPGGRRSPPSESLANRVIQADTPLVVEDTAAEGPPDGQASPARFLAAYPIHDPSGVPIGALTVADWRPRRFGKADLATLRDLAELVEDELIAATTRQAGEDLALQNALLEARSEATNDGILMTSNDRTILSFNRRLLDLWQFSQPIRVGQSLNDLIPLVLSRVRDPAALLAMTERAGAERVGQARASIQLKDDRTLEVYSTPFHGPDGTNHGRVTFFHDATERVRAQEELVRLTRRQALILNSAGDGIIGLDQKGKVTFANPGAARMTGFTVEELIGRRLHDLVHHHRADGTPYPYEECPVLRVLDVGSPRRMTGEVFWRKDGSSFPVEYVSAPIPEGLEVVGAVLTFKDISERRIVERMKDEFISLVSHELRTPLTSIRGSLGLLASGLMGPLPSRAQHMLDIAVKNTDRLVNLINDILDIERIESGKVSMQKADCDAADVITQAAEVMQAMADRANVTLSVSPVSAPLFADHDRIVQVLTNLLSNAIKFSYPGGTIWLDAEYRDDDVTFRVKDQGRGIPPDKLEKIFERFQQVDTSDSREKGGTGLGLAICRSIVHQHSGRIWAETGREPVGEGLGPGSTFFFTLPAVVEERPVAPGTVSGDGPVLVVDDDASIRAVVQTLLERKGYSVITASSGLEAIDRAFAHRPRAILLDLLMPGLDGWETMARLKERPATAEIPVVILSVLEPAADQPPELRFSDWLTKPLDENSLFQALERAIGQSARTPRVLVVEDDQDLAQVLIAMFERHGVETFSARTGRDAIQVSQRVAPDLLVLDVILPEGDGFAVVDWLRQHDRLRNVSLVVYSAKDLSDADRARLKLEKTAYLTKGRISPREFETEVIALLNRIVTVESNQCRTS